MKKIRQIAALIGIILLVAMYIVTLFAAIFDNPHTFTILKASIACTIIIPVVLWVMKIFLGIAKPDNSEFEEAVKNNQDSEDNGK